MKLINRQQQKTPTADDGVDNTHINVSCDLGLSNGNTRADPLS